MGVSAHELASSFRPALETDIPGILRLRYQVSDATWWSDPAFVRWRYFERRALDGTTPYWIVEHRGEIIGACGLEPVVLVVDGVAMDAVRTLDIMVRPDYDGRGLGAFMNLALFQHFPVTIVTGSNNASHHLLTKLFHHTLDLVFWKDLIESRELIDERLRLGPLAGLVAAGADLVLKMVRRSRAIRPPEGTRIEEITEFDSRATDLARSVEQPGRVIVRRSADYLNWRFVQNPRCAYRAFGAFIGDRLTGYLVTRLNAARPNPRREGEVVDWLSAGAAGDPESPLPALIAVGVDALVTQGAGLVTCAAHGAGIEPAADANGFRFRSGQRIPFFVRAASESVHRRLSSASGWYLTRGDLDVE
jgi:hypothetical protein